MILADLAPQSPIIRSYSKPLEHCRKYVVGASVVLSFSSKCIFGDEM